MKGSAGKSQTGSQLPSVTINGFENNVCVENHRWKRLYPLQSYCIWMWFHLHSSFCARMSRWTPQSIEHIQYVRLHPVGADVRVVITLATTFLLVWNNDSNFPFFAQLLCQMCDRVQHRRCFPGEAIRHCYSLQNTCTFSSSRFSCIPWISSFEAHGDIRKELQKCSKWRGRAF